MTLKINNDLLAFVAGVIVAYWFLTSRSRTTEPKSSTRPRGKVLHGLGGLQADIEQAAKGA